MAEQAPKLDPIAVARAAGLDQIVNQFPDDLIAAAATMAQDLANLPAIEGTPERISLWVQILTGSELQADGTLRLLEVADWQQRRLRASSSFKHAQRIKRHWPHQALRTLRAAPAALSTTMWGI